MSPLLWTLAAAGVVGLIPCVTALILLRVDVDRLYDCAEGLCAAQYRHEDELAELRAEIAALRARLVRLGRAFPEDVSPSIVD